MAVQVPRIERAPVSNTLPQNDRINLRVQDQSSAILNQTNAISSLGNKVGDIYQKYEDDKIEQLSSVAEQEFSNWNNQQLQRLKQYEGDPTDAYVEYEKAVQSKRDEILQSRPDLNDRVRRHFTSRLDSTLARQDVAAKQQYGMQQEVYANNVFESGVKLKKDNLTVTAGYIRAGDPSSYEMFDQNLNDIKKSIVKRGLTKGTVKELPDDAESFTYAYKEPDEEVDGVLIEGRTVKVAMSDIAKQRFAKEASEGVKNSIEVLIAGGQITEAKEMQEKYKGYIDPISAAKIEKKFTVAGRKSEANSFLASLNGLPEEKRLEKIESLSGQPELQDEVLKRESSIKNKMENLRKLKNEKFSNEAIKEITVRQKSGGEFYGPSDIDDDKYLSGLIEKIDDPKERQAVYDAALPPKVSDTKSVTTAYDLLDDDEFMSTATLEKFIAKTPRLSKVERNKMNDKFQKAKNPTEPQERQARKEAYKLLRDNLLLNNVIKKDPYSSGVKDKEFKELKYREKFDDWYSATKPSYDQVRTWVKSAASKELEDTFFNREAERETTSQGQTKKTIIKPKQPLEQLSPAELYEIKKVYAAEKNKGRYPNPRDLNFINWYNGIK